MNERSDLRAAMAPSTKIKKSRGVKNAATSSPAEWKLRRAGGLQILESPRFAGLDWLVHGFSTRPGGESCVPESGRRRQSSERALNLGFTEWDERERVLGNRERFFQALGAARMRPVILRQIHSDIVVRAAADSIGESPDLPKGDALITCEPGILLIVQTADCIPVLLADTRRRAITAVHSGWRGTSQRIAEKALGRMRMEFGTRPEDVLAAIGPGIGRCCYEVGHEVVAEFASKFPAARDWFDGPFDALTGGDNDPNWLPWLTMRPPGHSPPPPRARLDLFAANRAILADAGIPPENISVSGLCTASRTDLFFSYRRERTTGRMMAAIGIRA
ncbi:MAG TPA: peptidoglycan editing factor PgeF [Verrucomicrobiae bacterium]|nr:peptidoglycan editing factor PgeF [Verrucomicrobiae bacterium]